ncbi:MAG: hypothetical protein JJ974_07065 [Phycisphaerales bacterium]|nr:hypothetical protein [Phycisphaerales bacterium]
MPLLLIIVIAIAVLILLLKVGRLADEIRRSRNDPDEHIHLTLASLLALLVVFGLAATIFWLLHKFWPPFPSKGNDDLKLLLVIAPLVFYNTIHRFINKYL